MRVGILVPCYAPDDRAWQLLGDCLRSLDNTVPADVSVLLVDDGSPRPLAAHPLAVKLVAAQRLILHRRDRNRGAGAARNAGLSWLRSQGFDLAILLDGDCIALPGWVEAHVQLHRSHPNVTAIGGSIRGTSPTLWGQLDGIMSWFTSLPQSPPRPVRFPYHVPTTNLSLKLNALWFDTDSPIFCEHLPTGEDVALIAALRRRGLTARFSPEPQILHRDRDRLGDVLQHQWRWGLHTYAARLGRPSPTLRLLVAIAFAVFLPAYALLATLLILWPWFRHSPRYLIWLPLVFLMCVLKGIAAAIGALLPPK